MLLAAWDNRGEGGSASARVQESSRTGGGGQAGSQPARDSIIEAQLPRQDGVLFGLQASAARHAAELARMAAGAEERCTALEAEVVRLEGERTALEAQVGGWDTAAPEASMCVCVCSLCWLGDGSAGCGGSALTVAESTHT